MLITHKVSTALLLVRYGIQFPMMMVLMIVQGTVDATVLVVRIKPSRMVTLRTLIRPMTRVKAQQLLLLLFQVILVYPVVIFMTMPALTVGQSMSRIVDQMAKYTVKASVIRCQLLSWILVAQ